VWSIVPRPLLRHGLPAVGRNYAVANEGDKDAGLFPERTFQSHARELFALHTRIVAELPTLDEADGETALENLRKARRVLTKARSAP